MWYPWTVPDEIIGFMEEEFERFGLEKPSNRCLDETAAYVLTYVAKTHHYPLSPEQALSRYMEDPPRGLTETERRAMVPEIEIRLKMHLREVITDEQLHLCLFSALLFCWSEGGELEVSWFRRHEIDRPGLPMRIFSGG